jgi:hypothetical protein
MSRNHDQDIVSLMLLSNERKEVFYLNLKDSDCARCPWLTPVILATQEAEIRRIMVQSQPRQIVHKTLSQQQQKNPITIKGWWSGSRCRP